MKKGLYLYLLLLILACNQATEQNPSAETQEEVTSTPAPPEKQKPINSTFQILKQSNANISKLEYDGEIVNKRYWQDANGENIALFTQTKEELFAYHYTINADEVKLMRRVYDFEKDCEFDLFLELMDDAFNVTDLDQNNIGELTFAYKKACISDVSPKELKLLMLENGEKYIIRGFTSIDVPGVKIDGAKEVDSSFDHAPTSFRAHADQVWDEVKEDYKELK